MAQKIQKRVSMRFREELDPSKPFTYVHAGACPACELMVRPLEEVRDVYFVNGAVPCDECASLVDLWTTSLEFLDVMDDPRMGLQVLGNKQTWAQFQLTPGRMKEVDLGEFGLPIDASILGVSWTPYGGDNGCLAAEIARPSPGPPSLKRTLYGIPIGSGTDTSTVNAVVTWTDRASESRTYLVDAYMAAAEGRLTHSIVPACASIELSLMPVILEALSKYSSKKAVDDVRRDLKLGIGLKVLMPAVCRAEGIPPLRPEIVGELDDLRRLRNDFVHKGVFSVTQEEVNRFLCAAHFGNEFSAFLKSRLNRPATE